MKRRRIVVFSLVSTLAIFIVIKVIGLAVVTIKAQKQRLPSTYSLRPEDSMLFNEENRRKLAVIEIQNSTVRQPVSFITYDGEYSLILCPLNTSPYNLNKNFVVEEKSTDVSNGVPYAVVDNNAFKFKYALNDNVAVSQVYFTLQGESIQQLLQNDSMVCYGLRCRELSVRYGKEDAVDLYVKADKYFSTGVPLTVLFYRKKGRFYFLLLSPNKKKNFDPQLLPRLVSVP